MLQSENRRREGVYSESPFEDSTASLRNLLLPYRRIPDGIEKILAASDARSPTTKQLSLPNLRQALTV
ncbi:hypothetical protein HQ563_05485 [bacterium]|nr:hypothetical protein [bacterium]